MKRKEIRENVFIAAFELTFQANTLDEILQYSREYAKMYEVDEFGERIIRLSVLHAQEIDEKITTKLTGWNVERLPRVCLVILRLSVAEMMFGDDDMDSIVINEAVELAKKFSSDDDYQFVNGILGSISREIHPVAVEG
ncbi:MAG: transcription antitermination factor NusB [Oscillospiraceae bacterium]